MRRAILELPRSARPAVFLAATLYARILDKIEQQSFDVFSRRAQVGPAEKLLVGLPALARARRTLLR